MPLHCCAPCLPIVLVCRSVSQSRVTELESEVRKLTNQLEREKKRADDTEATTSAQYRKKVHRGS